jgi:hypothetical protein
MHKTLPDDINPDGVAAERKAARPLLRRWHKAVETAVREKKLFDLDYRLVVELANYPSANHGECWPGLDRLSAQLGRHERTVRRALKRLSKSGFLLARQRGQGETNAYTFMMNGGALFASEKQCKLEMAVKVIPINRTAMSAPDQTAMSAPDRTQTSAKPSEENPPKGNPPPPPPTPEPTARPDRCPIVDLEGERRARRRPYTFNDLCKMWTPIKDEPWGPAARAFDRLSADDRLAIENYIGRNGGRLHTGGTWLCKWIQYRRWELPLIVQLGPGSGTTADDLSDIPGRVFVEEDSSEWKRRTQIALNAGRARPRATCLRDGKPGYYFLLE